MSQTIPPVAAKPSLLATILTYFSSPADRSGLIAVAVALATGLSSAWALAGTARISAIVVAVIFAAYGVLRIVLPDNAAIKGGAALADTEQSAKDLLLLVTTKQPAAFATFVSDLAKVANDFVPPAPPAPAAVSALPGIPAAPSSAT